MPFNEYIIIVEKCSTDLLDYLYHEIVFVSKDSKKVKMFISKSKPKSYFLNNVKSSTSCYSSKDKIDKNEFYSKLYNILDNKEINLYAQITKDIGDKYDIMEYFRIYIFKID